MLGCRVERVAQAMLTSALLALLVAGPIVFLLLVRFCKRPMAALHRTFTNRVTFRFAARLPGFAIVVNMGRQSGRIYRTPVNVSWRGDRVLIASPMGVKAAGLRMYWPQGAASLRLVVFHISFSHQL
jgi:hypothetical protein